MTEQLTKRELVAAMVLQGLLANERLFSTKWKDAVERSFKAADEFLRQSPDNDPNDLPR